MKDVIDSRDIIDRIEELRDLLPDNASEVMPGTSAQLEELRTELRTLEAVAYAGESSPDWQYGTSLIRDSYFTEYIRELIHDCYEMPKDDSWPFRHMKIDYQAAADEARADYFELDFNGVTYLVCA